MNEKVLFKLVDVALNLVAVGLEREMILGRVKELEASGASPEAVVEALKAMRDEAIAKAQAAISGG